jgi:hypothetical protein
MDCYEKLAKHIQYRINYSSSLYQLYKVLCDVFYYNKKNNTIYYIHDWKVDSIKNLNLDSKYFNVLNLEYGEEEIFIHKLGNFDKWNPRFLHPKIYTYKWDDKNDMEIIDRITLEENLIADFSSNNYYDKIYQTLKICNLIL